MIKICKDVKEIIDYKKFSSYICGENNIPVLNLSKTCFSKAREIFAKGYVLIEVKAQNGKTVFYLKMCRDMIEIVKGCGEYVEVDVNFGGCNLQEENVDTSLLEKTQNFIFEELEEYTYEITEFIKNRYPDAHIFFLDQYAKYFWDNDEHVTVLNSIWDIGTFCDNQFMFVCKDIEKHEHIIPESISLIYNSLNVMNSLCWARKVEHLGAKNYGKTILLIDIGFASCGLAYIVRTVCALAYMGYERGWIPVVNLTEDNLYIDFHQYNMWEQYFEPLSNITVSDALESANVICMKHNNHSERIIHINPYFREIWGCPWKHLKTRFKREVIQYFNDFMPNELQSKEVKVLGAFIRGTDAITVSETEALNTALECKEIMENNGFDKVFLATEDLVYFEAFKSIFRNGLLYIEQKRVMRHGNDKTPIGKLLNIKIGSKYHFGLKYLMVTYSLSKCEALVYNIPSGGYYLANKWCEDPYEFSYHIGGERTEIGEIIKCFEMIKENALTAVYGTGHVGKGLLDILKRGATERSIVFCDKKAEVEKYSFDGYQVIEPSLLLEQYDRGNIQGIIVASSIYAEEIYDSLMVGGVPPQNVVVVKNLNGVI